MNQIGNGTDHFFDAWKRQVETSVRAMEAVIDATAKMRGAQLGAAKDTHQRALELEKAITEAKSAQEMWTAQWNWALDCAQRSASYWQNVFEAMNQANSEVAHCVQKGIREAAPAKKAG